MYFNSLLSVSDVAFAADPKRVEKYRKEALLFNGKELSAQYFTPNDKSEKCDLIILTTKWGGFRDALDLIEPIVGENTLILPLLNGLLPYELAVERYGKERVKRGYYIGCTSSRQGSEVHQDGGAVTVMESCKFIEELFGRAGLTVEVSKNIEAASWQKYIINIGLNQCSILDGGLNWGEIMDSNEYRAVCRELMEEAESVAIAEGIEGAKGMAATGYSFLDKLNREDYSSMAQDFRAGRETEWGIFGEDLIRRASHYGINVPQNMKIRV